MSFRKIGYATLGLAFATTLARVCGLAREVVSADVFGTTLVYDAFLLAFMIPNFFRGLLAEGALSTAFIPVLTGYLNDGTKRHEVPKIVNVCFTLSLVVTVALSVLALVASFTAVHFLPPTSKWYWTFLLLKYTFPYLVFISLAAVCMGYLNAVKHFAAPAYAPIILDGAWIVALLVLVPLLGSGMETQILGLCAGVVIGGVGQFLFQVPFVNRRGIRFRLDWSFRHPAVVKMGRLLAPVMIGVAVGPVNLMVDYGLANSLAAGSVSALWYATRVFQLPLGIFAVSLSTVVLPWFAEHVAKGDHRRLEQDIASSFNLLFLVLVPSSVFLMLLGTETVSVLFLRGAFDRTSLSMTSSALFFFSIGLTGYGAAAILTRAFYGFHDTRTPVLVGLVSIAVNVLLDLILMRPFGHAGIALSTSLVGCLNGLLLLWLFRRKHLRISLRKPVSSLAKTCVASAAAGWAVLAVTGMLSGSPAPVVLVAAGSAGIVVVLLAALFTKPLGYSWI